MFLFQPKCDLYWPDAGSETYGEFVVSLLREDVLASYTLRTFSLRLMKTSNGNTNGGTMNGGTLAKKDLAATLERTIYQYHFTAWPDHGVPLHALPLISFIRNSAAASNTSSDLESNVGPIVVHCRYINYM
jgi:receptor-type tyrosine-protein phosphatase gamma